MRVCRTLKIVVAVLLALVALAQPTQAQSVIPLPSGQLTVTTKEKSFPVKLRAFVNPFRDSTKPNWAEVDPEEVWSSDNAVRPEWTDSDDVYLFVDFVGLSSDVDMRGLTLDGYQHMWQAFPTPYGYAIHLPPNTMKPVIYSMQAIAKHHADRRIYNFLIFTVQEGMAGMAVGEMNLHVRKAPPGWQGLSRALRHRIRSNFTKVQTSDMELDLPPSLAQALAAERAGQASAVLPSTASAVTTTCAPRWLSAQARIAFPMRDRRKNANSAALVATAITAASRRALSMRIGPIA